MANPDEESNLPPIPDGGLAEGMPEWLRRPPAWRTLPDREVAIPEPDDARALPDPDVSVIDPREFLTDDDLPDWLRSLGRARAAVPPVAELEPGTVTAGDVRVTAVSEEPISPQPTSSASSRFVPTSPPVARATPTPNDTPRSSALQPQTPRRETAPPPGWQGAWMVAMLAALLVVAIAVIVVLVL